MDLGHFLGELRWYIVPCALIWVLWKMVVISHAVNYGRRERIKKEEQRVERLRAVYAEYDEKRRGRENNLNPIKKKKNHPLS